MVNYVIESKEKENDVINVSFIKILMDFNYLVFHVVEKLDAEVVSLSFV